MGEGPWILYGILVVVGSLHQTRRPGVVSDRSAVAHIGFAILVLIHKEVRIGGRVVDDGRTVLFCVRLDGSEQCLSETVDLGVDAFRHVTIAIPVRRVGGGPDLVQVLDARNSGMAALARIHLHGQLMNVMAENKIQEGDSFSVAMIKTANIRQEVEAALEVMSHSPAASEDSINLIGKMRDRLHKSIPYTVNDVLKAESLADANPDMKFVDAVKQSGVKSAKPADDDAQKAQQAFGSYEPNKYTYGINPATGKFARKLKE